MSESERIRRIQEQANKYVARNRCVDSSLLTMKRQAQASSVTAPATVAAVMQKAASCAVCSDTDTSVTPYITLAVPCINNFAPPFTQQNLSTMYVTPCTDPGNRVYFPPAIYDGSNCTFNRNMTPS